MTKQIGGFPGYDNNFVSLEPISHTYADTNGEAYESVSHFIGRFTEPFNGDMIAARCAGKGKYMGMTKAQVLQAWEDNKNEAIDHGNRLHDALEMFEKTTIIDPKNEDLRPFIMAIMKYYEGYYRSYPETLFYSEKYKLSGTADKPMARTSSKKSIIDIDDYKTNLSKGIEYESPYGKFMLGPLSHLEDCNYNKYSLQLSIYSYLLEQLTGRKIGKLNIMYIPADDFLSFRRIPTPYLKYEVMQMLEARTEICLSRL